MSIEQSLPPRKSNWDNLMDRRVPHILGSYLVLGFTVVQFTEWVVDRYLFSSHWVEITFFFLIAIIPAVALVAYNHGSPGKEGWSTFEKAFIGLNLVGALLLVSLFFGKRDLGKTVETVMAQTPQGDAVEKVVAKAEFRKKLGFFYFENLGDTSLDWLSFGMPYALEYDIEQDMFIDVVSDLDWRTELERHGISDFQEIPLSLKRELAEQRNVDYFLDASYQKSDTAIQVDYTLYESPKGKEVKSGLAIHSNMFDLIDDLSLDLRKAIGLSKQHINQMEDRNIKELLTENPDAYKKYLSGMEAYFRFKNFEIGVQDMTEAVAIDPNFAVAMYRLGMLYTTNNNADKAKEWLIQALDKKFSLPDVQQLELQALNFQVNGESEKMIKAYEMLMEFHPNDLGAYYQLYYHYRFNGNGAQAKEILKKGLEVDPGNTWFESAIAAIALSEGNNHEALEIYQRLADRFPKDPSSFTRLGSYYYDLGAFDEAIEYFEKANILDATNLGTKTSLSFAYIQQGNFEKSEKLAHEVIESARSYGDKTSGYNSLLTSYFTQGRTKEAAAICDSQLVLLDQNEAPLNAAFSRLSTLGIYYFAGQDQKCREILRFIDDKMRAGIWKTGGAIGRILYSDIAEDLEGMEAAYPGYIEFVETSGMVKNIRPYLEAKMEGFRGNHDNAIRLLNENLETISISSDQRRNALIETARLCRKAAKYKDGIAYLQPVYEQRPNDPLINLEMARLNYEWNKLDEAKPYLTRCLDIWKDADQDYKFYKEAKALESKLYLKG